MSNASDLFIKALENEGVEIIYAVPGEENLDFLEALRKSTIKLVLTRHEQSAGFMAATYGRLTGKTGVCLATLGPGATNLLTSAAYAQLGAFPMLMITGQKPIKQSKQGQFQIIDVVSMMRPITKYAKQIVNANMIPSMVREAFRQAEEERPGAVHLELPEDIAAEQVDSNTACVFTVSKRAREIASQPNIDDAVNLIQQAKHPFVLIGAGANRSRICKALSQFIDITGIPFFNTQMGKGVVSEEHPLFLGTAALSDHDYLHCAIDFADLIINIGHDVVEKPPFFMKHGGTKVIHVNFKSAIVDNVYFPQLEVVGDISDSLLRIGHLAKKTASHNFDYFFKVQKHLQAHIRLGSDDNSFPVIPQRFVSDVRKVMAGDGIIALDNGTYKIWFARNYPALLQNTVLLDNALATMGAGLPSAMEAARLYPERQVMAICGDGGFMMNSQEIETAVRMKLNLVILILRDDAYGMIRWKQYGMGFADFGLEFGNPNFVQYADSFGIKGYSVSKTEDFLPLMEQCFAEGGIHLIDLPIDYSDSKKVLIDELRDKVCLI
tara:strand:+ start:2339 stop:3991 length:1653 start_codon:yes stop_codon:yes gene_type:complete